VLHNRALGHQHNPTEWHLFIDSLNVSLKAVLVHKGNKLPSVPLVHATNIKESNENMKLLLEKMQNIIGPFVGIYWLA